MLQRGKYRIMKAVILAKSTDYLIENKNYRLFYEEKSLVDILAEKLIKVLPATDIYLSCETEGNRNIAEKWGINFINRDNIYTRYDISNVDVVANVCSSVPTQDDILWCTCVEPFFDEYAEVLECWEGLDKRRFDSLNIVYPTKKFMLDQGHNPIGFGFGHWHKYSQTIPAIYQISWATAILSRECIEKVSYLVGKNPYWYDCYAPVIDIDTMEDFKFASLAYKAYIEKN